LFSLPRILSKAGYCSRTQAERLIEAGRVSVDGRVLADAERKFDPDCVRVEVDGQPLGAEERIYLLLNKPRGLVTTREDEKGRTTVYSCLEGALLPSGRALPWLGPVGRLDQASEGMLLFTNDTRWADRLLDPRWHIPKTYHVQLDRVADEAFLARMELGVEVAPEILRARSARLLREGERHSWIEVVLDEGRNRQIRRIVEACDAQVLRLVRVAIGKLPLGDLPKGSWRLLEASDLALLAD